VICGLILKVRWHRCCSFILLGILVCRCCWGFLLTVVFIAEHTQHTHTMQWSKCECTSRSVSTGMKTWSVCLNTKNNITKQLNPKPVSVRHLILHCLTVVCYFVAWKKGLTLDTYMLCFVITNSVCAFLTFFYVFVTGMFFTKVCMYVWACVHMHVQTGTHVCMHAGAPMCVHQCKHACICKASGYQ